MDSRRQERAERAPTDLAPSTISSLGDGSLDSEDPPL
jgi:hypothetical protein